MMIVNTVRRTGIATRRTELTSPPVAAENTSPAAAIIGASNPTLSSNVKKFCTFVISEVLLVTRLAVPNRSISAAENSCTLEKT